MVFLKDIWTIIKTGYKLIKLKDRQLLNDNSKRKALLGKLISEGTENSPIILYTEKGDIHVTALDFFKQKEIQDIIKKQVAGESQEHSINLIASDSQDEFMDYKHHFYKPDPLLAKVWPYLDEDFRSLLKLSSYVKKALDEDDHKKVADIKKDISQQYGKNGNKICTLYLRGYLMKMIKHYLNEKVDISEDTDLIKFQIKDLKNKVMEYSEYIFFVDPQDNEKLIANEIKRGLERNIEYVALHASGKNIKKINEIFRKIKPHIDFKKYIPRITDEPYTKSAVPVKDIVIKHRGKRWEFDFIY